MLFPFKLFLSSMISKLSNGVAHFTQNKSEGMPQVSFKRYCITVCVSQSRPISKTDPTCQVCCEKVKTTSYTSCQAHYEICLNVYNLQLLLLKTLRVFNNQNEYL